MANHSFTFVAILTTGSSAAEDRVVEAAAVRMQGVDCLGEFSQLADPGDLSSAFQSLTGLARRDVLRKPDPRKALDKLLHFCEGSRLVVYDAPLFRAFLEAEGLDGPDCLDEKDLARIACPAALDYSLDGMARGLALEPSPSPRALQQARLAAQVWHRLLDQLVSLPPAALDAICRIAEAAADPLASVLAEAASRKGGFELSQDPERGLQGLFTHHRELFQRVQKSTSEEPGDAPLPTEGICRMFTASGSVGQRLLHYEQRGEQVDMVQAVCEALNEPQHLMVEAGTGTGKSLAYLLPAIAWACTNNDKVLVSTNTKNLQEQLYRKDLPFLLTLLPGRFEAALLKGRRNYLCVRRFLHMLMHFERELAEPQEFMALAPLVAWAAGTEAGDLAECNGFLLAAAAPSVVHSVVSGPEECAGRACRFRSRCFLQRARALAQLADIIVVNHALLFSDLGLDQPVLPPYRCVIFDEAHNLEQVATEAMAVAVDGLSVFRVTNLLYRQRRGRGGSGLLATAMYEIDTKLPASAGAVRDKLTALAGGAMEAVEQVVETSRQFFELLSEPFRELPPYLERVLLRDCQPDLGPRSEAWDGAQALRATIRTLGEKVEDLAQALADAPQLGESGPSEAPKRRDTLRGEELAGDLRSQVARLREVSEAIEFVLSQEEESHVYWLERTVRERRTFYSIHAAPLEIGTHMREFFFSEKRCAILTSATLQVEGRFDYMLERLGAEILPPGRMRCVAVGSPFDYERQALIGVTTCLPDPGGRREEIFDLELSSFLIDLLQCSRGRALVLFTSYSLLDAVYGAIKGPLERAGITVLAQGHSGSREAITSSFRSVTSSVLLGTRSFWEGVDISGETLSCLVLTKLPFHVFTDPLVRGRTEYLERLGRDPFLHYTLPEAVISFRQGFGRLIRTRTDTGVIIVTDRRLVTKAYGRSFLGSLPAGHSVFRTREEGLRAVREFFQGQPPQAAR